jgi:hypothetical protein
VFARRARQTPPRHGGATERTCASPCLSPPGRRRSRGHPVEHLPPGDDVAGEQPDVGARPASPARTGHRPGARRCSRVTGRRRRGCGPAPWRRRGRGRRA